jgi:hypothetical protein
MIVTVDAGTNRIRGAVIFAAWKHGVEIEPLVNNQLEIWSGREDKIDMLLKDFPSVKVLHRELFKEV